MFNSKILNPFFSLLCIRLKWLKLSKSIFKWQHVCRFNLPWLHRVHLVQPPLPCLAHPDWQIACMSKTQAWCSPNISKTFKKMSLCLRYLGYSLSGPSNQAHPHCQADPGYPARRGHVTVKVPVIEEPPVCFKRHLHVEWAANFFLWIQFHYFMLPFQAFLYSL